MITIHPKEIDSLANYIYRKSGIQLDQKKGYLFETRLGPILENLRCATFQQLHRLALDDNSGQIERAIIDAISTNETLFFRDSSPFDLLRHKILPELIDCRTPSTPTGKKKIKIWSAAASTGQEIYSIAITIKELIPDLQRYQFQLLGTDISDAAISQASLGKYNKFEIERGLCPQKKQKYFIQEGSSWRIKDEIRSMVSFKKFNLMNCFQSLGQFDIIFCRNVAIYFGLEDRKKLFEKMEGSLTDDGYLVVGSTESLTGVCPRFMAHRHLKSIFYKKTIS